MDNSTGYVVVRADVDEGVVVFEQTYRFPSRHYYEVWARLYPEANTDESFDRWLPFRQTYSVN